MKIAANGLSKVNYSGKWVSAQLSDEIEWKLVPDYNLKCYRIFWRYLNNQYWQDGGPVSTEEGAAEVIKRIEAAYKVTAKRIDLSTRAPNRIGPDVK